jgi:hypothetical protein
MSHMPTEPFLKGLTHFAESYLLSGSKRKDSKKILLWLWQVEGENLHCGISLEYLSSERPVLWGKGFLEPFPDR